MRFSTRAILRPLLCIRLNITNVIGLFLTALFERLPLATNKLMLMETQ